MLGQEQLRVVSGLCGRRQVVRTRELLKPGWCLSSHAGLLQYNCRWFRGKNSACETQGTHLHKEHISQQRWTQEEAGFQTRTSARMTLLPAWRTIESRTKSKPIVLLFVLLWCHVYSIDTMHQQVNPLSRSKVADPAPGCSEEAAGTP